MSFNTIVLFLIFLVGTHSYGLSLNVNNTHINHQNGWYNIFIPCEGGSGDYEYQFKDLSSGLYAKNDRLYIHKQNYRSGFLGVRLNVFDLQQNIFVRRVIIFQFTTTKIAHIYETDYNFDFQSENNIINYVNGLKNKNSLRSQNEVKKVQGLNQFYTLPSQDHVQSLIKSGNIVQIKLLIDQCIESSLSCEVKAKFLSELLSNCQRFITVSSTEAQNLKQTIIILQQQIRQLNIQLRHVQSSIIDINSLKNEQQKINIEYERIKGQLDSDKIEINEHENNIRNIQIKIFQLKTSIKVNAQKKIQTSTQRISDIDKQILSLERKIENLKLEKQQNIRIKDQHINIILNTQNQIQQFHKKIQQTRTLIQQLQNKIRKNSQIRISLSIKISRIQKQIQQGGNDHSLRISNIKQLISQKTSIISLHNSQISTNIQLHDRLQGSLNQFTIIIERHYYNCYNVDVHYNTVTNNDDYKVQHYNPVLPTSAFMNYLRRVYGTEESPIKTRSSGTTLSLRQFNIFSPNWIKVYGIPFSGGIGSNLDYTSTQFRCTNSQDLQVFKGIIQSINRNVIVVRQENTSNTYTVHLSGCSRLETATTSELPEAGDFIYWKGQQNLKTHHYNAFEATCY